MKLKPKLAFPRSISARQQVKWTWMSFTRLAQPTSDDDDDDVGLLWWRLVSAQTMCGRLEGSPRVMQDRRRQGGPVAAGSSGGRRLGRRRRFGLPRWPRPPPKCVYSADCWKCNFKLIFKLARLEQVNTKKNNVICMHLGTLTIGEQKDNKLTMRRQPNVNCRHYCDGKSTRAPEKGRHTDRHTQTGRSMSLECKNEQP